MTLYLVSNIHIFKWVTDDSPTKVSIRAYAVNEDSELIEQYNVTLTLQINPLNSFKNYLRLHNIDPNRYEYKFI